MSLASRAPTWLNLRAIAPATRARQDQDGIEKKVLYVQQGGRELLSAFQFKDGKLDPAVAQVLQALPLQMSRWQIAFHEGTLPSNHGFDETNQENLDRVALIVDAAPSSSPPRFHPRIASWCFPTGRIAKGPTCARVQSWLRLLKVRSLHECGQTGSRNVRGDCFRMRRVGVGVPRYRPLRRLQDRPNEQGRGTRWLAHRDRP